MTSSFQVNIRTDNAVSVMDQLALGRALEYAKSCGWFREFAMFHLKSTKSGPLQRPSRLAKVLVQIELGPQESEEMALSAVRYTLNQAFPTNNMVCLLDERRDS